MSSCIDTASHAPAVARPTLRRLSSALLETIFVWITLARSRRDLALLDDRALRDVGIDRATAAEESAKPFWRTF